MARLSLDDPRWLKLMHRGGCASDIPGRLRYLLSNPTDLSSFNDLWPYLCSEGTAWSAAYASTPYIIEIASSLSPKQRFEYVWFVGLCQMCETGCPEYLSEAHQKAVVDALPLAAETILCDLSSRDTMHLLAAIAALKGYPKFGDFLCNLDCGCPICSADLLPIDEFP